ncbi:response regulator [Pantanalinema rosaneae CENA516]|uniref:response regulator n=1 Tax=Pantanalinema rosaneae TaxID=1620701 RepID=UPI003D6FB820
MRLLLVEDDEILARQLVAKLAAQRYAVDLACDGEAGWDYTQAASYQLIVLDVGLPKLDGISLCRRLRCHNYQGSILLLTAKGNDADKVQGLDAGADDYVVKPCTIEELCARIRALLRRMGQAEQLVLAWGELQLDPSVCQVTYHDHPLSLTPKSYALLELFLRYPQRVFSRSRLLEELWNFNDLPDESTVRAHIKLLRQQLKAAGVDEEVIETVYGLGYRLKPRTSPDITMIASASPVQAATTEIWQQVKEPFLERLSLMEQAIAAFQAGTGSEQLRSQAEQAAHKLAGSLGMFGYHEGSRLSRNLEQGWQFLDPSRLLSQLQQWVDHLRQELHTSPMVVGAGLDAEATATTQPMANVIQFSASPEAAIVPELPPSAVEARILVVDDDSLLLKGLQQLLSKWGMDVLTLRTVEGFWSSLVDYNPDLLILDVDLPGCSGIDLCHAIRQDNHWNALPILFLSAHRQPESIHRLYAVGADDYIAKPFTEPELVTRILNRLERHRLIRLHGLRYDQDASSETSA